MADDNPFTIGPPPPGTPQVTAPEVKPVAPAFPAMPVAPPNAPPPVDSGTHKLPDRPAIPTPPTAAPRHAAPAEPETAPTPVAPVQAGPTLVLADGRSIDASKPVLLGRNPAANSRWPGAQLVSVDDESKSVSKTHAAFAPHEGSFAVTDLDSTNGVLVTLPDGTELVPEPGEPLPIDAGVVVDLGEYRVVVRD